MRPVQSASVRKAFLRVAETGPNLSDLNSQFLLEGFSLCQAIVCWYANMETCISEFSNVWRIFPTNEQEGELAEYVRAAIAQIDHPDQPATARTQPKPPPKQPDHEPIIIVPSGTRILRRSAARPLERWRYRRNIHDRRKREGHAYEGSEFARYGSRRASD